MATRVAEAIVFQRVPADVHALATLTSLLAHPDICCLLLPINKEDTQDPSEWTN